MMEVMAGRCQRRGARTGCCEAAKRTRDYKTKDGRWHRREGKGAETGNVENLKLCDL